MRALKKSKNPYFIIIFKFILIPTLFYLLFFIILTYPAILNFNTHFFTDTGDGLQNIWNIWWVNKAVVELQQNIWKTNYLHFPYGTTLLGHTLNPLNGIIAIPLLKILSLTQTYNLVILFIFVVSGITAFILSYYFSSSYWFSLISGYIYTFSSYHFAHATGHLQTISFEFLPLFILGFIMLLQKPKIITSLFTAVILYLNLLLDYYLFFYCILISVIIYFWYSYLKKNLFFIFKREHLKYIIFFLIITFLTSGNIVLTLFLHYIKDPLIGAHNANMFSTDILAPFIPGGHWRFSNITEKFWLLLPGNIHENSVFLGITVIVMLVYVQIYRREIKNKFLTLWYIILLFFLLLSYGPYLHIWGKEYSNVLLPYYFLEKIIPFISLSGVPVRMMAVVTLMSSLIFAIGFKYLWQIKKSKIILVTILLVLFIEYLPAKLPSTKIEIPRYIKMLKNLNDGRAVLDYASDGTYSLYYQTIYDHPQAFGYIARIPQSVLEKDLLLGSLIYVNQFSQICDYFGIKYLITQKKIAEDENIKLILSEDKTLLYDIDTNNKCRKFLDLWK